MSNIYEEFTHIKNKEQASRLENWVRHLTRYLSKEDIQITHTLGKMLNISY